MTDLAESPGWVAFQEHPAARRVVLVTTVDLGEGESRTLELFEDDVPEEVAGRFCRSHGLAPEIAEPLAEHLRDNLLGEPQEEQTGEVPGDPAAPQPVGEPPASWQVDFREDLGPLATGAKQHSPSAFGLGVKLQAIAWGGEGARRRPDDDVASDAADAWGLAGAPVRGRAISDPTRAAALPAGPPRSPAEATSFGAEGPGPGRAGLVASPPKAGVRDARLGVGSASTSAPMLRASDGSFDRIAAWRPIGGDDGRTEVPGDAAGPPGWGAGGRARSPRARWPGAHRSGERGEDPRDSDSSGTLAGSAPASSSPSDSDGPDSSAPSDSDGSDSSSVSSDSDAPGSSSASDSDASERGASGPPSSTRRGPDGGAARSRGAGRAGRGSSFGGADDGGGGPDSGSEEGSEAEDLDGDSPVPPYAHAFAASLPVHDRLYADHFRKLHNLVAARRVQDLEAALSSQPAASRRRRGAAVGNGHSDEVATLFPAERSVDPGAAGERLYEQGRARAAKHAAQAARARAELERLELEGCTFSPDLSATFGPRGSYHDGSGAHAVRTRGEEVRCAEAWPEGAGAGTPSGAGAGAGRGNNPFAPPDAPAEGTAAAATAACGPPRVALLPPPRTRFAARAEAILAARERAEMAECTFAPAIDSKSRTRAQALAGSRAPPRFLQLHVDAERREARLARERAKAPEGATFAPKTLSRGRRGRSARGGAAGAAGATEPREGAASPPPHLRLLEQGRKYRVRAEAVRAAAIAGRDPVTGEQLFVPVTGRGPRARGGRDPTAPGDEAARSAGAGAARSTADLLSFAAERQKKVAALAEALRERAARDATASHVNARSAKLVAALKRQRVRAIFRHLASGPHGDGAGTVDLLATAADEAFMAGIDPEVRADVEFAATLLTRALDEQREARRARRAARHLTKLERPATPASPHDPPAAPLSPLGPPATRDASPAAATPAPPTEPAAGAPPAPTPTSAASTATTGAPTPRGFPAVAGAAGDAARDAPAAPRLRATVNEEVFEALFDEVLERSRGISRRYLLPIPSFRGGADELTFAPRLDPRSQQLAAQLRAAGAEARPHARLYAEASRRRARLEARRAKARAEEVAGLTFAPELVARYDGPGAGGRHGAGGAGARRPIPAQPAEAAPPGPSTAGAEGGEGEVGWVAGEQTEEEVGWENGEGTAFLSRSRWQTFSAADLPGAFAAAALARSPPGPTPRRLTAAAARTPPAPTPPSALATPGSRASPALLAAVLGPGPSPTLRSGPSAQASFPARPSPPALAGRLASPAASPAASLAPPTSDGTPGPPGRFGAPADDALERSVEAQLRAALERLGVSPTGTPKGRDGGGAPSLGSRRSPGSGASARTPPADGRGAPEPAETAAGPSSEAPPCDADASPSARSAASLPARGPRGPADPSGRSPTLIDVGRLVGPPRSARFELLAVGASRDASPVPGSAAVLAPPGATPSSPGPPSAGSLGGPGLGGSLAADWPADLDPRDAFSFVADAPSAAAAGEVLAWRSEGSLEGELVADIEATAGRLSPGGLAARSLDDAVDA